MIRFAIAVGLVVAASATAPVEAAASKETGEIQTQKVADEGDYIVVFKSGATVTLNNVTLLEGFFGTGVRWWLFQRAGQLVSFTAHKPGQVDIGRKDLDESIDAILRIK